MEEKGIQVRGILVEEKLAEITISLEIYMINIYMGPKVLGRLTTYLVGLGPLIQ